MNRAHALLDQAAGLYNHQIETIAKQHYHTRDLFIGCYSPDTLPQIVSFPSFFICNMSMSWEVGSHWIAICCLDPHLPSEIFDSLALGIQDYSDLVENFLKVNGNGAYKINKNRVQPLETTTCGYYALAFLEWRSQRISFENIMQQFSKVTLQQNDRLVTSYVFGHMTPLYML